jgi:hypothetical protein
MTGASAAARAIFAQRAGGAAVRSLQELHAEASAGGHRSSVRGTGGS